MSQSYLAGKKQQTLLFSTKLNKKGWQMLIIWRCNCATRAAHGGRVWTSRIEISGLQILNLKKSKTSLEYGQNIWESDFQNYKKVLSLANLQSLGKLARSLKCENNLQVICNNSHSPYIALLTVCFIVYYFWRHINRCTTKLLHHVLMTNSVFDHWQAKICHLQTNHIEINYSEAGLIYLR